MESSCDTGDKYWRVIIKNQMCHYCGTNTATTRDHIVPKSRGGPGKADNIVPACIPCNLEKANKVTTCTCAKCEEAKAKYEPVPLIEIRTSKRKRRRKRTIPVCQITGAVWCNCEWCRRFNR